MSRKLSYRMAINEALHQTMGADERMFILDEDMAKTGGDLEATKGIWEKWPNRIKDMALPESAVLGLSCGAVMCGLKPVPEITSADFLGVYFDQLTNNATKSNFVYQGKIYCGITVRAVQDGGIRCAYHHSTCVESWLMNTLGLMIACPTTPYEAKGMLISAIKSGNLVLFLERKTPYNAKGEAPQKMYKILLYEAEVERKGSNITTVVTQIVLDKAHEVMGIMAKEGTSVEIIDPRAVYPYNKDTTQKSVVKTGRIILAQEGPKCEGWGTEPSATISEDVFEYLCAPIKRTTSLGSPVPYAPVLEDYVLPQLGDLVKTCRELMEYQIQSRVEIERRYIWLQK